MRKMIALFVCIAALAQAGDVFVKSFDNVNLKHRGDYIVFTTRVCIANTGGEAGHWRTELQGVDKDGFPIVKQLVDIQTYIPPHSEVKDADEMFFEADDLDDVVSWRLVIKPRGY